MCQINLTCATVGLYNTFKKRSQLFIIAKNNYWKILYDYNVIFEKNNWNVLM